MVVVVWWWWCGGGGDGGGGDGGGGVVWCGGVRWRYSGLMRESAFRGLSTALKDS